MQVSPETEMKKKILILNMYITLANLNVFNVALIMFFHIQNEHITMFRIP